MLPCLLEPQILLFPMLPGLLQTLVFVGIARRRKQAASQEIIVNVLHDNLFIIVLLPIDY